MADKHDKSKNGTNGDDIDDSMAMKLTLIVATAAAGWVAQKLLSSGWKGLTGKDAPKDPLNNDSRLGGILVFGALTGAVAALSRVVAAKGAKKVARRVDAPREIPR